MAAECKADTRGAGIHFVAPRIEARSEAGPGIYRRIEMDALVIVTKAQKPKPSNWCVPLKCAHLQLIEIVRSTDQSGDPALRLLVPYSRSAEVL